MGTPRYADQFTILPSLPAYQLTTVKYCTYSKYPVRLFSPVPLDEPRFRSSFLPLSLLPTRDSKGHFLRLSSSLVNLDCVHFISPRRTYTSLRGPPAEPPPTERRPREQTTSSATERDTHREREREHICTMPPRSSLTSSFSVTDANNEVICPLKNNDGSSCRKRCTGVSWTFHSSWFSSPSLSPSPRKREQSNFAL